MKAERHIKSTVFYSIAGSGRISLVTIKTQTQQKNHLKQQLTHKPLIKKYFLSKAYLSFHFYIYSQLFLNFISNEIYFMSNYGIVELSNKPGSFRARVPMLKKGTYTTKDFSNEKHPNPMTSAQAWRDERGESTWGEEIWMYIKKTKSVRCLWGKKGGVSICHKTIEGEGEIWIVMWREKGKPKIMPFLLKDDPEAKKRAEEYAKKKKVELSFLNRI